jgi:hypothetical protein
LSGHKRASRRTKAPPPLPRRDRGVDVLSRGFAREAEFRQGVYESGGRPTLYDPVFTRQRVPEAVLRHEEVHQNLALQTFHGVATLILNKYARVAEAGASLAACEDTQWYVQETGATYAELAFIQRVAPLDFSGSIDALPSAATKGDPYREAFDFATWILPLDDDARHERNDPRTLVIGALCSCSMATAILRELARADFDDARFASWIRNNSPDARFDQIGRAAGPGVFRELATVAGARLGQGRPTPQLVRELFDDLSITMLTHVQGLTAEPLSELEAQAEAAVSRLRQTCPEFVFDVGEALHPTGPLFTESPDKRKLLAAQFRFDDPTTNVDLWLEACQRAGGLHVISGKPDAGMDPSISFVCIPSFPGNPVPDDLRVRLRPEQFFDCVKRFPGFPNVMTMIGDGWLYWASYLGVLSRRNWARKRVQAAIRITVHLSLSLDLGAHLLAYENLGEGGRVILLELDQGGGVALFDNPRVNAVYAIQKFNSALALGELRKLLARLDVTPIKDPTSVVDFELLYWIIQREFNAPAPSA